MNLAKYMHKLFSGDRRLYHWMNIIFALFFLFPVGGFIFFGVRYDVLTDKYIPFFSLLPGFSTARFHPAPRDI